MTDLQLVTLAITLLAIFGAMYGNRKAVEDMRDVLRAEFKGELRDATNEIRGELRDGTNEIRGELRSATNEIHLILQRIENKLDHFAEIQATHSERITRLEQRG
jgi:hypothetical protein